MKLELFNAEVNQIWKKAASASTPEQLNLELELYKRLLNFFQVGDYYYLIFNVGILDLEFASKEVENVLGYDPKEFNMQTLLEITHPDDRPYFLNFENKAGEFFSALPIEKLMKYKVRYDYRLRKKNGVYVRVLHQSTVIEHDENRGIIRTLGIHTDITHLKVEGTPVFSIIGLDGEPSYINIDIQKIFDISNEFLTKKEKQVLLLLIEGRLSKEIAGILHIAKETVDRHRKNMIAKNNCKNTAELVSNAIRKGWV